MSAPYVETWREQALCREVDPEIFFPPKGASIRTAKRICGLCPVAADCLAEALTYRVTDDYGIRGGLSERERKALRRERAGRLAPVVTLPVPSVPQEQPRRAA